jgi:hypothetical protein
VLFLSEVGLVVEGFVVVIGRILKDLDPVSSGFAQLAFVADVATEDAPGIVQALAGLV